MKRCISILALILSCSISFAESAPYTVANSFTAGAGEAIVILNQLGLYSESGGTLTLKESLILGDKVTLLGKAQKFKIDKTDRDFVKVRAPDGMEGWVRTPYALPKATLAVVKADMALVYSQPRDVNVTAQTISKMTVVGVILDGSTPAFQKVNCFDIAQNIYFTETEKVFVAKEDLSFSDIDINAVIIYTTAMASKNKDIRANLFKVIEKKYSASIFFEAIRATLAPETVVKAKATVPASGAYVINDDNVNVRENPDEVNGKVIVKLARGTEVQIVEMTEESYTVGGATAPWYKLAEPSGWVFGSFISAAP